MHPWQKRARECEFCSTEHAHQTTNIDVVKVPSDNAHCRRLLLLGAVINWRVLGSSSSHRLQGELMPDFSHIGPGSAALLVMDYQVDTLTRFMTAEQSADAIARVPELIPWHETRA
jgi:hypothetical protein